VNPEKVEAPNALFPQAYIPASALPEALKRLSIYAELTEGVIPNIVESINENKKLWLLEPKNCFVERKTDEGVEFVELLYDKVPGVAVDLTSGLVLFDLMIIVGPKGFLMKAGSRVNIVEVSGYRVFAAVREGDTVAQNDRIAYVLTGKGNVRTIRSPYNGVVVYVGEIIPSTVQRYIILIAGEGGAINVDKCAE